jgi:hypothetical protein
VRSPVSACVFASIVFFSCSSTNALRPWNNSATPAAQRPADIALEKWVGRGMMLQTKIRLENGREFPCALDTGSPTSALPVASEPMLGKRRGSGGFFTMDGPEREQTRVYTAPAIYLGDTRLQTGSTIETWNNPEAILGMDCLCHYCIQLDFAAGKIRFLDPERLDTAELGQAFPFVASPYAVIKHEGFFQDKSGELLIDTGCFTDGYLTPRDFNNVIRKEGRPIRATGVKGKAPVLVELPECIWNGEIYGDLIIGKGPQNLIGMRFLARHLVTFNFPKGVMYLKRVTAGPLK